MDGELGNVRPGFHEGEEVRTWHCPVEVFLLPKGTKLKLVGIYSDEGVLCIDVEEPDDN